MYITTEKRCDIEFRPEIVIMPTRFFKKIEFKTVFVQGVPYPVIWGYWTTLEGVPIPCEECICGKYDILFAYPGVDCKYDQKGELLEISAKKGVYTKISLLHEKKILVQIWAN
jgi:hypothetical protein